MNMDKWREREREREEEIIEHTFELPVAERDRTYE